MTRMLLSSGLLLLSSIALAQDKLVNNYFKEIKVSSLTSKDKQNIHARKYKLYEIDINQLYAELENAPLRDELKSGVPIQIEFPQPDGSTKKYQVLENSTMNPELGVKFPEIKTYDAYGVDDEGALVKFDLTPQGLHAMIMRPGKSPIFIDPLDKDHAQYYVVYDKKDFITSKTMKCGVTGHNIPVEKSHQFKYFTNFNSCELKKYRLAMAATAQYTSYQGGAAAALAAQVTTMNRVNGVYETDMAITMQIIGNNTLIIYTNPNTQPYTSGNPNEEINQNQTNIDAVIGPENYDIGHLVDAAGSGLAQLRSVCNTGIKAMGVTGQENPSGDPFDIDFVAHEMGHQFGANHVQNNSCQRNNPTAVEPGSGSTIMSYAGICAPNIQANSDAYFNGISLQEMGYFVSGPTHTCPVRTAIPSAPIIQSTNGFATIPANTPFALNAAATKSGGNEVLTYTWEQQNNEVSQQPPVSGALGGPNFRSVSPTASGTRYFPNLIALANNGPFTWEVIPSVSRIMNFRTIVRRNTPGGSCNAYKDVTLTTASTAGPFVVTYPQGPFIGWVGKTAQSVTWNVANTNIFPIFTRYVDILLSIDGGLSYPYTVLNDVENTGSQVICVPNLTSNTARIMVRSKSGTFFNISNTNFSIAAIPDGPPILSDTDRNRMETREAFIKISGCLPLSNDAYTINGIPGATVRFDALNQRFIVGNITTPRRVVVTITATDANNISRTSNPMTIPSIL